MWSEGNDRLHDFLKVELQITFTENMKNIPTKNVMKINGTRLLVQFWSSMSKLSARNGTVNR